MWASYCTAGHSLKHDESLVVVERRSNRDRTLVANVVFTNAVRWDKVQATTVAERKTEQK